jgi:uncharacterized protein YbbK (DUF523 family)
MIIVSACLAGLPCRWNGEAKPNEKVMALLKQGKAMPLCPEQLGGMPTPRKPSEILGSKVLSSAGEDLTEQFKLGAEIVLMVARQYECKKAILKSKSPSCGSGRIYDGSFSGKLVAGDGVAAGMLKENGIAVYTEEEL